MDLTKKSQNIALDMSKAFDTVDLHKLLDKLCKNTTIPNTFLKFISNYIKDRKGCYNNVTCKQRTFNSGVPQGGVLSPLYLMFTWQICAILHMQTKN